MKKVLLTGVAGFIGSHFCELLLKRGYFVIGVDNYSTGSISNIQHLISEKNFQLIHHDINLPLDIRINIDYVVHFASPASPRDYTRFPIETLKVSSVGAFNCLEIAKFNSAVFLVASTSEVYGDPLQHPQAEEYNGNVNPIGPRSVYDEAKRFQEALTFAYHNHYNVKVRIARIFNTYGPRMRVDDGRAIPSFINQALMRNSLTVFGDGSQTRSFCYIDDTVEGLYQLMNSRETRPINIGNPEEVTISQLASEIISMSGFKLSIDFKELPIDDPKIRCPDIARAKTILNWVPKVSRRDGLLKTYAYFKNIYKM